MSQSPLFSVSNERLSTIVVGLEPNERDTVLAVCGSGDQAFALSEYAPRVVAVDINPEQIRLAKQRAEYLKVENYGDFLKTNEENISRYATERTGKPYFTIERLERIRSRIEGIHFRVGNITELADTNYTKVYLSNCFHYQDPNQDQDTRDNFFTNLEKLNLLTNALSQGVLVYHCSRFAASSLDLLISYGDYDTEKISLILDRNRTVLAEREEVDDNLYPWYPRVYVVGHNTVKTPTQRSLTQSRGGWSLGRLLKALHRSPK